MTTAPDNPLHWIEVLANDLLKAGLIPEEELLHGPLLLEWGLTAEDVERLEYTRIAAPERKKDAGPKTGRDRQMRT